METRRFEYIWTVLNVPLTRLCTHIACFTGLFYSGLLLLEFVSFLTNHNIIQYWTDGFKQIVDD